MKFLFFPWIIFGLLIILPVRNYSQTCLLSGNQLLVLTNASDEQKENILLPCFEPKGNSMYRREYAKTSKGYPYYDIVTLQENLLGPGQQVFIQTTNSTIYMKYKTALKSLGFKINKVASLPTTSVYYFKSYRMQTSSSGKNADGDASYWILLSIDKNALAP
jgi:hypothetical protein